VLQAGHDRRRNGQGPGEQQRLDGAERAEPLVRDPVRGGGRGALERATGREKNSSE